MVEFLLFNRENQSVGYRPRRPQPGVFDYGVTEIQYILFEFGKWYRVAYRKEMRVADDAGDRPEEFVFLEHPDMTGVAIGFRRDHFIQ